MADAVRSVASDQPSSEVILGGLADCRMLQFQVRGDWRGNLVAVEASQTIPFGIERVYYIYGTKQDVRRGAHAHRALQQVLIAVSGQCRVLLEDGRQSRQVLLDSPDQGLFVGPGIWRELFDFSADAVVLVLASQHYDEADYIRDHQAFLRWVSGSPT
ncbi:MAG TPA: FdtA/QdtA family cupin domain-containing protein [Bauldia sp.]|nr:FdtA/QdtA family cupin domain-containing protein [Bauldia sp.]